MERTAGIDWGSQEHAVCVLNGDGSIHAQFTVPHTAAGLAELVRTAGALRAFRAFAGRDRAAVGALGRYAGRGRLSGSADSAERNQGIEAALPSQRRQE